MGFSSQQCFITLPDGASIRAEVMKTAQQRAMGMQFRSGFEPGTVMLFVHPAPGRYSYHMRNVRMSLDLILMNSSGQVVRSISKTPSSFQGRAQISDYYTPVHSFAIEAPMGWAKGHGLKLGDRIWIG